ncbi:MAG: AglZ/HisF2 family acetamidino modification protein [Bacteroidia bacterium]|nr:AglZ/HisF2 family acetamidino modification protein [Bacteroidia bacterium]
MGRIRVIPVLLLEQGRLVKTIRFRKPSYVGDPVNAVKIFNEKEVDEIIVVDISATPNGTPPDYRMAREIAGECFMPLCYGGGVRSLEHARQLFQAGAEKVAINTAALENPKLVESIALEYGSQSVVVSLDVKKNMWGQYRVCTQSGRKELGDDPKTAALRMESAGAGELMLTSIDRDGTFEGYDTGLLAAVCHAVRIPVIACGGAASIAHMRAAVRDGGASATAAGSMFVYKGVHRAVLISYPAQQDLTAQLFDVI